MGRWEVHVAGSG